MIHRVETDSYAPRWSDHLLATEHGRNWIWRPEQLCMFLPGGLSDRKDVAAIILRRELILFSRDVTDGTTELTSLNNHNYRLRREGDEMVLSFLDQRRWVLANTTGNDGWRLVRIEWPQLPGIATHLIYREGLLSELVYPDGARALFQNDGQFVTRVDLPNRHVIRLRRDEGGYLNAVELNGPDRKSRRVNWERRWVRRDGVAKWEYVDQEAGEPSGPLEQRWLYENDGNGRIVRLTEACGNVYRIEYTTAKLERGEEHRVIVTNDATGAYQYMRHQVLGDRWVIDRGVGDRGVALDDAFTTSHRVYANVSQQWRLTEVSDFPGVRNRRIEYKPDGFVKRYIDGAGVTTEAEYTKTEKVVKLPNGAKEVTRQNDDGQVLERKEASGTAKQFTYAADVPRLERVTQVGAPDVVYSYADNGRLREIAQGEQRWTFEWDGLLRLRRMTSPDGTDVTWEWNETDKIIKRTEVRPFAVAVERDGTRKTLSNVTETTVYDYTEQGTLKRETYSDGSYKECKYVCASPEEFRDRNGTRTAFRYDDHGRLATRQVEGQVLERFRYDQGNFVVAYGQQQGKDWRVWRYEYSKFGDREKETQPDGRAATWEYDEAGHLVRQVLSDGRVLAYGEDKAATPTSVPPKPAAVEDRAK